MNDLVSLICPCYNAEKFISRFLESVLLQTYKNVQVIIVDDGSRDGTIQVVESFRKQMEDKFTSFLVLRKENGGAASAVNMALKYVEGKYLAWVDCDDIMSADNLYKKMSFLDNNLQYGLVVAKARAISEVSGKVIKTLEIKEKNRKENIFEQLMYPGVPCYPGVFMIRTKLLFDRLNKREIYFCNEVGQNWQLLLPVAYDNRCGYIEDYVYDYYIRLDSHSHNTSYNRELLRTYEQEKVLRKTLSFLSESEEKKIFRKISLRYCKRRIELAFEEGDVNRFAKFYIQLNNLDKNVAIKYNLNKITIKYPILRNAIISIKKAGGFGKRIILKRG